MPKPLPRFEYCTVLRGFHVVRSRLPNNRATLEDRERERTRQSLRHEMQSRVLNSVAFHADHAIKAKRSTRAANALDKIRGSRKLDFAGPIPERTSAAAPTPRGEATRRSHACAVGRRRVAHGVTVERDERGCDEVGLRTPEGMQFPGGFHCLTIPTSGTGGIAQARQRALDALRYKLPRVSCPPDCDCRE